MMVCNGGAFGSSWCWPVCDGERAPGLSILCIGGNGRGGIIGRLGGLTGDLNSSILSSFLDLGLIDLDLLKNDIFSILLSK